MRIYLTILPIMVGNALSSLFDHLEKFVQLISDISFRLNPCTHLKKYYFSLKHLKNKINQSINPNFLIQNYHV